MRKCRNAQEVRPIRLGIATVSLGGPWRGCCGEWALRGAVSVTRPSQPPRRAATLSAAHCFLLPSPRIPSPLFQ